MDTKHCAPCGHHHMRQYHCDAAAELEGAPAVVVAYTFDDWLDMNTDTYRNLRAEMERRQYFDDKRTAPGSYPDELERDDYANCDD